MHGIGNTDEPGSEMHAQSLMAQTDAEDGNPAHPAVDQRHEQTRSFRGSRTGGKYNGGEPEFFDVFEAHFIIADDEELLTQLFEIIAEIKGKRIVVVEDEQQGSGDQSAKLSAAGDKAHLNLYPTGVYCPKSICLFFKTKSLILAHYLETLYKLYRGDLSALQNHRELKFKLLSGVFVWFLLTSWSMPSDIFKEVENAISLGNSKMMVGYLNTSIELETPTSKGIYSRGQAELILDKFFQKYPPISFTIAQKGNSSGGSRFAVGNYVSTRERAFRVTIFVKKSGADYLIQEIKFE